MLWGLKNVTFDEKSVKEYVLQNAQVKEFTLEEFTLQRGLIPASASAVKCKLSVTPVTQNAGVFANLIGLISGKNKDSFNNEIKRITGMPIVDFEGLSCVLKIGSSSRTINVFNKNSFSFKFDAPGIARMHDSSTPREDDMLKEFNGIISDLRKYIP